MRGRTFIHKSPSRMVHSRDVIGYGEFTNPDMIFDTYPSIDAGEFVQEVIVQSRKINEDTHSWFAPIPVNDPRLVQSSIEELLSLESPPRLYRVAFEFFIPFKYTIDVNKSVDNIILELQKLTKAVQILREWTIKKKAKILCTGHCTGILHFLVTKDIFSDACSKFSWSINDNEVVVLVQQ